MVSSHKAEDTDNVCCPDLMVVKCGGIGKHRHLVCGGSTTVISNKIVKEQCIGNYESCILRKEG